MKKLIVLIGLLVAFSASAKDCEKEADGGGMAAVRSCVMEESEKPMAAAYDGLIKTLGTNQDAISAIKEAQDDWKKFKFSTCGYVYAINGNDANANCIVEFNDARVKTLNRYAKEAKVNN